MAGRGARKRALRLALAGGDAPAARDLLADESPRGAATLLLGLVAEPDPYTRHQAAGALGEIVSGLAADHFEAGREVMRRLVWSLNEESGAVPWGSPEAMAEVMARCRPLADEFINLLISYLWPEGNYIEFEPLQAAVAWGIGRVARAWPELVAGTHAGEILTGHLDSPDPAVRGTCAWALGPMADAGARAALGALAEDTAPCAVYDRGRVRTRAVADWAADALGASTGAVS